MVADANPVPTTLPAPDPALHMICCWIAASAVELKPKARERAFRRMAVLMDPTRPSVVRIRPRTQDRAVEDMRVKSAAYWRAVGPALQRLIDLEE